MWGKCGRNVGGGNVHKDRSKQAKAHLLLAAQRRTVWGKVWAVGEDREAPFFQQRCGVAML